MGIIFEIIGEIIIGIIQILISIPLHYIGAGFRWLIQGGKQPFKKIAEDEMNVVWGIFVVALLIIAIVVLW